MFPIGTVILLGTKVDADGTMFSQFVQVFGSLLIHSCIRIILHSQSSITSTSFYGTYAGMPWCSYIYIFVCTVSTKVLRRNTMINKLTFAKTTKARRGTHLNFYHTLRYFTSTMRLASLFYHEQISDSIQQIRLLHFNLLSYDSLEFSTSLYFDLKRNLEWFWIWLEWWHRNPHWYKSEHFCE